MPRPEFNRIVITGLGKGWDSMVDTNFTRIEELMELKPFPLRTVHRATPSEGSALFTDFAAGDYVGCYAHLVDAAAPATNGYMIFSDGTNWRYQRTHTVVT